MITAVLPVDLTWGEVYDIACYYRGKLQQYAELANDLDLDLFPSLKGDMLRYADEASDLLRKWDGIRVTFHRYAVRREIAA